MRQAEDHARLALDGTHHLEILLTLRTLSDTKPLQLKVIHLMKKAKHTMFKLQTSSCCAAKLKRGFCRHLGRPY